MKTKNKKSGRNGGENHIQHTNWDRLGSSCKDMVLLLEKSLVSDIVVESSSEKFISSILYGYKFQP